MHKELLGKMGEDMVTGFTGVVIAVSSNLDGSTDALLASKEGRVWVDIPLLEVSDDEPIVTPRQI